MSLASRVTNLLSGSPAVERDPSKFDFGDDGLSDEDLGFADRQSRLHAEKSDAMAPKDVKEEGRPPYLHVSAG
jgi:hypothetical protein